MKEGRRVLMTIWPFTAPIKPAKRKVATIAASSGKSPTTISAPKTRPAKAIIEPIERSNSPPIISNAAAMARIPSCAAGESTVMTPARVNIAGLAVRPKKTVTRTRPATAPNSGRRISRATSETRRSRSSRASAAGSVGRDAPAARSAVDVVMARTFSF